MKINLKQLIDKLEWYSNHDYCDVTVMNREFEYKHTSGDIKNVVDVDIVDGKICILYE